MARLIIEVPTMEQAEVLAHWYEGQGEQDAEVWFEMQGTDTPMSDVQHKGGCIHTDDKTETVTLYCK